MKKTLTLFLGLVCAFIFSVTAFATPIPTASPESGVESLKTQFPNQNFNQVTPSNTNEQAVYGLDEATSFLPDAAIGDRKLRLVTKITQTRRMNFTEYLALLNERKIVKLKPKWVKVLNLNEIPF